MIVAEASGSADKVGKPAAWNDELPLCCFQNTVIRLQPYATDSSYILLLLRHCYFNQVFAKLSDGMGINHLGAGRLAQVGVPLATEAEQKLMVAEVDRQLQSMRSSRLAIDLSLDRARELRSSIFLRAFRGELVEPTAGDDSAKALLAKIAIRREKERAAISLQPKKPQKMNSRAHRPLLEVLRENPEGLTPEALLAAANYTSDDAEMFYAELSKDCG